MADIARSKSHDISVVETGLACLEVFALGGGGSADLTETGYWAVRASVGVVMSEAGRHIAMQGLAEKGASPVVRLIAAIATRFGSMVTAQAAAPSPSRGIHVSPLPSLTWCGPEV